MDEKSLAHRRRSVREDEDHEGSKERNCFYCLEGWVFLGSTGYDGEEVVEAICCRRCKGTGQL